MKRFLFATAVIGVLGLGSGCINKKGTTFDVFAPSIANVEYQHSYGDAVHVLQSENEFVICDKCQNKSTLERSLKPLPLSVRLTEPSPSSLAAVPTSLGTTTRPVPGGLFPESITPLSAMTTTSTIQHVEVITEPVTSLPVSTIESLTTSSSPLRSDTQIEKSAGPLTDESTNAVATVYFSFGSSVLAQDELQKILHSMSSYKGKNVVVTGFTCNAGTKQINDRLAIARAMTVVKILKRSGVKPLTVSGEGKCCYASDDQRLNRRVEIRITGNNQ